MSRQMASASVRLTCGSSAAASRTEVRLPERRAALKREYGEPLIDKSNTCSHGVQGAAHSATRRGAIERNSDLVGEGPIDLWRWAYMPRTIEVSSQKSGIGKTTTAANL